MLGICRSPLSDFRKYLGHQRNLLVILASSRESLCSILVRIIWIRISGEKSPKYTLIFI